MHRSLSETQFLCYKACIGSGIDVGRAQDISSSASKIGVYDSRIFESLPTLITTPEKRLQLTEKLNTKSAQIQDVLVVQHGPFVADCLQSNLYTYIQIDHVDNVLLLAGICLHLAPELQIDFTISDRLIGRCSSNRLFADMQQFGTNKADFVGLKISKKTKDKLIEAKRSSTLNINATTWSRIELLAKNTYVAENEYSRIAGAGAGLTDND